LQRAGNLVLQVYQREIGFEIFIVYGDGTSAFGNEHTGYSFFTATNTIFLLFHLLLC
jgi:hypothetical protein